MAVSPNTSISTTKTSTDLADTSTSHALKVTPGKDIALIDLKKMYADAYRPTYMQVTGKAWTEGKFVSYAQNWTFYGDDTAYVAVRVQRNGAYKFVSIAADPSDPEGNNKLKKAFSMVLSTHKPMWGLVSNRIATLSKRAGFEVLSPQMVTALFDKSPSGNRPIIPNDVVTGSSMVVRNDGTISVDDNELGVLEPKVVIVNKLWYSHTRKLVTELLKQLTMRIPSGTALDTASQADITHVKSVLQLIDAAINAKTSHITDNESQLKLESVKTFKLYTSKFV